MAQKSKHPAVRAGQSVYVRFGVRDVPAVVTRSVRSGSSGKVAVRFEFDEDEVSDEMYGYYDVSEVRSA